MNSRLSVGVDEAGRGCVLGPLVVATVAATPADLRHFRNWNVRDSKIVPAKERTDLAERIKERCWFDVRVAVPSQIDEAVRDRSRTLNGLEMELMADLLRTFRSAHVDRDAVAIIDAPSINAKGFGKKLHDACGWNDIDTFRAMHKADARHRAVGAASIIAKFERERLLDLIKQELGIDFGCGYPHDKQTIAFVNKMKTAPKGLGAVHVRWSWATAHRS
jgi:ribonuclease HII